MITDTQLEARLEALKAVTPPADAPFASIDDFKIRFFSRAHNLAAVTPHKTESRKLAMMESVTACAFPSIPSMLLTGVKSAFSRKHSFIAQDSPSHAICGDFSANAPASVGIQPDDFNTEEYATVGETPFVATARNPLSTFGADVDTAGYTNARRMIMNEHRLPAADSIRIDEFLNYFHYDYPAPEDGADLRPHFEFADAPWAEGHKILLAGIQARDIAKTNLPPAHYVFLIDNSGSMAESMDIVKEAMGTLARQLRPQDKVSVVTYGGNVETLMEGSDDTNAILAAVARLQANGFTPGGQAIQQAYSLAHKHFIPNGNNRIVLITDGDFNVGPSSEAALSSMVARERGQGICLSVIGTGSGNYKDNRMKMLANIGDGNYIYIDSIEEAKRAFTQGLTGQMFIVAHDVKFQLEFNPARVYAYRLIGYEMRRMEDTDFRDDTKDSGEIGVGQQVTALYEIIPADAPAEIKATAVPEPPPLRYSTSAAVGSEELLTFHLRYQHPNGGNSVEKEYPVPNANDGKNLAWAAAVAEFGMALRNSKYKGNATLEKAIGLAKAGLTPETDDERLEFIQMVHCAIRLVD